MSSPWVFQRAADDAKLGGVCAGLAGRWGVDPVLVRVAAVLLALTGGIGVILYLAGWLLLPVAGTDRAAVDDLLGGAAARWPRELWITLVVLACIVSFAVFGAVSPFGVAPALVLAAVWWFGFRRPRTRRARQQAWTDPGAGPAGQTPPPPYAIAPPPTFSGPPTPFTQAATAWQQRVAQVRLGVWTPAPGEAGAATWDPIPGTRPAAAPAPQPYAPAAPPYPTVAPDPEAAARAAFLAEPDPVGLYTEPAPVPLVRPGASLAARRLRLVTVVALGLTWLGLGIADAAGAAVSAAVYAAAGLLVVALGLVAATRFGRARGLLPAGLALALASVVASGLLGPSLARPAQEASRMMAHPVSYSTAAAFPAGGDRVDVGSLEVDLRDLTLATDATYRARVDTGRITVRTPPGTGVTLRFHTDTGSVTAYGQRLADGGETSAERVLVPAAAGQHTLTLDLAVDTGAIEVAS
ncbi:PspC domain-containing protein [Microlunatus flavus]|uniref:Phage shock protein PspC (Stress-responsive transcriptional regulator) n=1 Tax=Microlunatus flavus TaxID=1036181 RepID=A0A1H9MBA7_9ACTN|nr:PspC domain-containing protein [Microlunatus flavus]SER20891.1 Phage shock protein PspC (stress-responsive transcriptional regulator) [Microlunatus flavus]